MFKLFSDFFGYLFLLFLLLSPLFLLVGAFLIWKGSGIVRVLGWLLLLLVAYYRLSWISPWYVIRGSELVQEFKLYDNRFRFIQVPSVRWMEASHRLLILPSEEVVFNPKSPYYSHLLAVDLEARKTYWQPIAEVNLDETKKVESLHTGYSERRDGLRLYYASPSKEGPRAEYSSVGFTLPILIYRIPWFFSETSGWQWQKTYFAKERTVVRESESGPVVVELNQIVFNIDEQRLYGGTSAWLMEGKFLLFQPQYADPRVLALGPFNTSQDTQSKDNKHKE